MKNDISSSGMKQNYLNFYCLKVACSLNTTVLCD